MAETTIVRAKKNNHYRTISDYCSEDVRLSWQAKGLHTYVMTRPDNWSVTVSDLIKRSKDGKYAVYSILKELKESGYLESIRGINEKGRFTGKHEYVFHESPIDITKSRTVVPISRITDNPEYGQPEFRATETLNNNHSSTNNQKKKHVPALPTAAIAEFEDGANGRLSGNCKDCGVTVEMLRDGRCEECIQRAYLPSSKTLPIKDKTLTPPGSAPPPPSPKRPEPKCRADQFEQAFVEMNNAYYFLERADGKRTHPHNVEKAHPDFKRELWSWCDNYTPEQLKDAWLWYLENKQYNFNQSHSPRVFMKNLAHILNCVDAGQSPAVLWADKKKERV